VSFRSTTGTDVTIGTAGMDIITGTAGMGITIHIAGMVVITTIDTIATGTGAIGEEQASVTKLPGHHE
jgi:anaerobic selenocysteine-containing dehydrogenase